MDLGTNYLIPLGPSFWTCEDYFSGILLPLDGGRRAVSECGFFLEAEHTGADLACTPLLNRKYLFVNFFAVLEMCALSFSLQPNPSRDHKGHPLSTEPKRLKSQQGSDVLSSETETQHPPTGHSYTPLLQQSTHTMGTFFG